MTGPAARSAYFSFGNVAIDDLVYADGSTVWGVCGGGAMYAALGMALWTGSAAVVAPIGPDYGREQFSGIDFSQSHMIAHTMRNWGLYETDGSRHFLSRRDSLPWEKFSSNAAELDGGPYPFCHIAPMPWKRTVALAEVLAARGARFISLDLHDGELAAVPALELTALLEHVQIFLPSRQDTDILVPGRPPLAALRALRARLPQIPVVGVKCGADGALVHAVDSPDVVIVPPAARAVVDVTGAGDAFCGGFLAGFAERGDAVQAALWGTVSAAVALMAVGPAAFARVKPDEPAAWATALRAEVRSVPLDV